MATVSIRASARSRSPHAAAWSALTGLTVAGGLGSLFGPHDIEAKKKKKGKKKKHKKCKGKKKCGKKCIPKSACCPACGDGQTCQNGVCQGGPTCDVCPSGCAFSFVQDAIDAASAGDTITICAGTYTADIVIGNSLTLIGEGAGNTILQGRGTDWVVTIETLDPVSLQGLRIIGGEGGIGTFGTLELIGCTVSDNETDSSGGGIYNEGTVAITNSEVSGNRGSAGGGGILNVGTVTLTNSEVSGNRGSSGDGIFNAGGTVTLDLPSRITDNHATSGGNGGGIHNNGGAVTLASEQNVTDNFPNNCAGDSVPLCVNP